MSDTREKLSKWMVEAYERCWSTMCPTCKEYDKRTADIRSNCQANLFADYLIAHGVRLETKQATETSDEKTSEWIPVSERLPEKEEYTAKSKDGTEYYVQLLIAYKTDIVEYEIGYYDGYKWLSEMPMRIIKDVIAWKQFEPLPEPPEEG